MTRFFFFLTFAGGNWAWPMDLCRRAAQPRPPVRQDSGSDVEVLQVPKVLVAEDSAALANLLKFILERHGFTVHLADNGEHAANAAELEPFDAIVLDQQMPSLTGEQVMRRIRSSGSNRTTPLFLCTAKAHELDIVGLQAELDISRIFHKPFSPRDLVETLLITTASAPAS